MQIGAVIDPRQPAASLFRAAVGVVYDAGDGVTEHADRLSGAARCVYVLFLFHLELCNGGFDQLFTNSAGRHCLEMRSALSSIGAERTAALFDQALSFFPDASPATDRLERYAQREAFADDASYQNAIERLDDAYYRWEDQLPQRLDDYVRAHAESSFLRLAPVSSDRAES
jgi:hypothetical protein